MYNKLWKTKRTMKFGFGKFIVNFFNVMTEFFDRDIAKLGTSLLIHRHKIIFFKFLILAIFNYNQFHLIIYY